MRAVDAVDGVHGLGRELGGGGHPPTLTQGRRAAKRNYIPGSARKPSTSGVCSHSSSVSDEHHQPGRAEADQR